ISSVGSTVLLALFGDAPSRRDGVLLGAAIGKLREILASAEADILEPSGETTSRAELQAQITQWRDEALRDARRVLENGATYVDPARRRPVPLPGLGRLRNLKSFFDEEAAAVDMTSKRYAALRIKQECDAAVTDTA